MNLGFDLDKVLIDYPPLIPHQIIDRLYKKKSKGVLIYRIPSKAEQILRLITHHELLRPPITQNIKFLKDLSDKKQHKYYLISSRFLFLKKITEKLIKKQQFDRIFNDLYFNFENKQPHLFKNDVLKRLRLDRYVDDDLSLLKFLSSKHPKTKFFWLNKKSKYIIKKNLSAINDLKDMLT